MCERRKTLNIVAFNKLSQRTRERLAKHGFKAAHGALFQAALYLCSIAHTIDQPVL